MIHTFLCANILLVSGFVPLFFVNFSNSLLPFKRPCSRWLFLIQMHASHSGIFSAKAPFFMCFYVCVLNLNMEISTANVL